MALLSAVQKLHVHEVEGYEQVVCKQASAPSKHMSTVQKLRAMNKLSVNKHLLLASTCLQFRS